MPDTKTRNVISRLVTLTNPRESCETYVVQSSRNKINPLRDLIQAEPLNVSMRTQLWIRLAVFIFATSNENLSKRSSRLAMARQSHLCT